MERNSDCWYLDTCDEDCSKCHVYFQMKYQMTHSGLPESKQKTISLYLTDDNSGDREAYYRLAEIRKNIVDFVEQGKNLYICSNRHQLCNIQCNGYGRGSGIYKSNAWLW